jgi:hypothetical protein
MPETKPKTRKTTRAEKIVKPAVYETPIKGSTAPVKTPKATKQAQGSTTPAKTPVAPKKTGRPSKYDPEIARIICEQLSEGIPLRQICRDNDGFPAWRTVYDWMGRDESLSASIARARDIGYDALAEECLLIADTIQLGQKQVMTDEGSSTTIEDMLGHRKLQIETRLKLLAKFHPTKYGDRVAIEGVEGGAAIKTEDTNANKFLDIIRNMEMTKRAG